MRSGSSPGLKANRVLVCQNRTCLKQGAASVLAAFQAQPIAEFTVLGTSCMGQCGNGPMVQVVQPQSQPERVWYSHVHSDEVPAVIDRHLIGGQPVKAMLHRKFHHP